MAITAVTPTSASQIQPGDSFSFTIDDTYTYIIVKVQTSTALVKIYDSGLGGAQSGFTVSVVDNGSTHTFTCSRDAGWDLSPVLIYVDEDETGTPAVTNISYLLAGEVPYPQGESPYNPNYVGVLTVIDQVVTTVPNVSTMEFDGATIAQVTPGHVKVTVVGGGVTDHGALTGLGDDDHTQYYLTASTRQAESLYIAERGNHVNAPSTGLGEVWLNQGFTPHRLTLTDDAGGDTQLIMASGLVEQESAFFNERADHVNTPVAAKGELWVRSDSPNVLVFTDDTGTDTVLGAGGATDLDSVINFTTPDNAVVVPVADFLDFSEAGGGSTNPLLKLTKLIDLTEAALLFNIADSGRAIRVTSPSTAGLVIENDAIRPITVGSNFVFGNRDGIAGVASGGFNILAGQRHTDGGSTGGNVSVQGGIGAATDGNIQVGVDNTEELILSATTNLKADKPIKIKEQAAADADVAAYGQFWVKDDTPNVPMFTDDAGTDKVLGDGDVVGPASVAAGEVAIFSGTTGKLLTNGVDVTITGGSMSLYGTTADVRMRERATGPTIVAGFGGYWVRNDTPSTPMFRDDSGADHVLNAAGSGDVTGGSTSAIGELAAYTDTSGKDIGRSVVKVGSISAPTGTRTLGSSAAMCGGSIISGGTMTSSGAGSVVLGGIQQISGVAELVASASPSFVFGGGVTITGTGSIKATGAGGMAIGYVAQVAAGTALIIAGAQGSFSSGSAQSGATIEALGIGSIARGNVSVGGVIRVASIGDGGFASGNAVGSGSTIIVSGDGAFASGSATAGGDMLASGDGAFAVASVGSGEVCEATADNSAQFGVGTNALANSMSVGEPTGNGIRLRGDNATGSPEPGDFRCDGTDVFVYGGSTPGWVQLT